MPFAKGAPPSTGTQPIDMAGRRVGLLTVIERAHKPNSTRAWWRCRCDCGNETITMGKYLRSGDTRSCGCVQRQCRAAGNPKAGHGGATGGMLTREYRSWRDMKERCSNPRKQNYRFYGGKGVTVCERWRASYPAFLADMGKCPQGLSLDRIDPAGNYEPSNCRWADWPTQCANRRKAKTRAAASVTSAAAAGEPSQPPPPPSDHQCHEDQTPGHAEIWVPIGVCTHTLRP